MRSSDEVQEEERDEDEDTSMAPSTTSPPEGIDSVIACTRSPNCTMNASDRVCKACDRLAGTVDEVDLLDSDHSYPWLFNLLRR